MPVRLKLIAAFAVALAGLVACGDDGGVGSDPAKRVTDRAADRPNIVVVMTDDQRTETLEQGMPKTIRLLRAEGTEFTESIVTTPLCCPSRATFLTGQYGHNHGILINEPGYPNLVDRRNVLPIWMRGAGYQTALIGKYLHGYGSDDAGTAKPAPGWDDWRVMVRGFAYRDFQLGINGEVVDFGGDAYLTDQLTSEAVDVIADHDDSGSPEPLFMWITYWAPHRDNRTQHERCRGGAIPAPRDERLLDRVALPDTAASRLEDVSDKPGYVAQRDGIDATAERRLRLAYACQVASLRAVDRGVLEIRNELERVGRLGNTIFIFTSDNGFINGEHRIRSGKGVPYEEAIRVPLIITGVGDDQPASRDELVANIDLAPTILDLAKARPCRGGGDCRALDGLSLVGLLGRGAGGDAFGANRTLVVESEDGKPCGYAALRMPALLYVEYEGEAAECRKAERELYDLRRDPMQRDNLLSFSGPIGRQARADSRKLANQLGRYRDCEGRSCR